MRASIELPKGEAGVRLKNTTNQHSHTCHSQVGQNKTEVLTWQTLHMKTSAFSCESSSRLFKSWSQHMQT
jgi:hypothetical protein